MFGPRSFACTVIVLALAGCSTPGTPGPPFSAPTPTAAPVSPNDCIVGLSESGTAVYIAGASDVNLAKCDIISNSNLNISGTNSGHPVEAHAITYAGTNTGDSNPNNFLIDGIHAAPSKGGVVADPCSLIVECASLTKSPPPVGPCSQPSSFSGGQAVTIPPGTYCSQLIVNGVQAVTFAPGLYLLEAGMNVTGAQTVSGSGVTFYNKSAAFLFQGTQAKLTAPTSGPYCGILIYQPAANTTFVNMNAAMTAQFGGMIYAPSAKIQESGSVAPYISVVANVVMFTGDPIGDSAGTTTAFPQCSSG